MKHDKTGKFSRKSFFSSYIQQKNKQLIQLRREWNVEENDDEGMLQVKQEEQKVAVVGYKKIRNREIQNTQEIKRTLFNWTKQDKTCKFSSKSSFSSYIQHKNRKTNN